MTAARVMALSSIVALLAAACAAPERPPALQRELHQSASAARAAFTDGDLVQARVLYTHALDAARLSDDALALGNLAYNLAVVVAEQGDHEQASQLLAEAAAALQRARQPLHDVVLLRARLQWRAGDATAAQRALDALSRAAEPVAPEQAREATLLRGELACARGDAAAAQAALAEVAQALGDDVRQPQHPSVLTLAASLAETEGRPQDAALLHDRAAGVLQGVREYRRMAHALARAGDAYLAAGAANAAGDRFLRAAQSHLGAHDRVRARGLLQRARACAEQAADDDLRARVHACAQALGEGDEKTTPGK